MFDHKCEGQSSLIQGLGHLINNPDFSDITFKVEGREFYAHKLVLSILSKKFSSMFKSGFKESVGKKVIEIKDISYPVFSSIMQYLYTGVFQFGAESEGQENSLECLHEFLRVSDQYLLEDVKY